MSVWLLLGSSEGHATTLSEAAAGHGTEQGSPSPNNEELNLLLLEVSLGQDKLADVLNAYEMGDDILLPIGELARILTIGITVDQSTQTASGFLLREEQSFRLDPAMDTVVLATRREAYDHRLVRWIDGDLYVASRLLQRWWPIDLHLDMAALRLNVVPREKLPLQAKKERTKKAMRTGEPAKLKLDYPYVRAPYQLLSVPFIDNTLAFDLRGTGDQVKTNVSYSGFATGDLLGMEAAAYFAISQQDSEPEVRLTLARHDPDAGLLGPLKARSVLLGSIGMPAFDNVMRGTGVGNGILVSNRPLNLPSSYRSQTLRGELPPGWDVTLYFNEALIGFQQARADGLYEFSDQPLVYGRNEFRLVFNGPLGQTRVERKLFQLDQAITAPGELLYTAAGQRDDHGGVRQTLQLDFGIFDDVGVTLGGIYIDDNTRGAGNAYANMGARVAVMGAMVNVDHVREIGRGSLTELGIRTSVAGVSIDATHVWAKNFHSEFFDRRSDPLELRDRIRLSGTISLSDSMKLPMTFDVEREKYASGDEILEVEQRLSLRILSTNFTNMLQWRKADGPNRLGGVLQISRRVAGIGIQGQAVYSIRPDLEINSLAISSDKNIGNATRLNVGMLHDLDSDRTVLTAGINRNFGSFGLGISGQFAGRKGFGVGLQLFTAIGRDPQSGRVVSDWRPLAASGAIAAQVFIDDNQNGRYDPGEDPVEGAGFKINGGSRLPARTNADGTVLLYRLAPNDYMDIGVDAGTLEDPQLQAAIPGVRLLPRPGKAQKIDFPLVLTGEIDGTVYLIEDGKSRGIGNALLELVNDRGEVMDSTRSASDGFYVIQNVRPGNYHLRISATQMQNLGLLVDREAKVVMPADPDFISGIDFGLRKIP